MDVGITDTDLAVTFGCSKDYVQRKCRSKEWPHIRVARRYRFTPEHVERIAQLLTVAESVPAPEANPFGQKTRRTA